MRRRQGFTLVELLVAMALIIFIMAILSQAFASAMTTFRNLKALGDMAEKLRATTQLLQRDLSADHFEGKKRLSDSNFWINGPPQQGFFQIMQGSAGTLEGADLDTIGSYYSTNHSLSFTVKLRGNDMGDFFSATGGMAALSGLFGPAESRYQIESGGSYNYQWAAVEWFLVGSGSSTVSGVPLFTLYRRQALLVPDNNLVQPVQPAGNLASFGELSCWTNGANLYFNSPIDITDPTRRLWGGSAAYTPIGATSPFTAPSVISILSGSDIQLTDVVSFDVRVLTPGVTNGIDPFVTLWQAPFNVLNTAGGINNGNPAYFPANPAGPMVFDTWSSLNDGLILPPTGYSQWNVAGQGTSIPLWNPNTGSTISPPPESGPIIQAIQISIRIWDYKTNKTRQVTMVQAM
ncbi:MAG TPA: prepilin-type N-terminal cleavage/methylation domain-containing protein [Gemmataceae bacterium]|nr:prepilin-type N-terminal cleavage/methylation domain-containing protein [Gemmataceae bacterium]